MRLLLGSAFIQIRNFLITAGILLVKEFGSVPVAFNIQFLNILFCM